MENDSKPLAPALDPKRFPEIERFRINYAPRVGGPFAVDRLYTEIQRLYASTQGQPDAEDELGGPLSPGEELDARFLPRLEKIYEDTDSSSCLDTEDRHCQEDTLMLDMVEAAGLKQCAAKLRHSFDKLEHWYS